ncbi:MAG: hypothetical protein II304_06945 [Bacteroidales bacterium]|nr:hypothetical protein [Bacteroidales bacterium]
MLIQEQLHKNLYRSYFRGYVDGYDKKKAIFKNFSYYTTSPLYALYYAKKHNNWTVSEYKLKDQVNIFNARSKKDFFALHKYLIDNNKHYFINKIEDLKYRDWSGLLGDEKREELLNIIKHLGYDGFFNFEYDKKLKSIITNIYGSNDYPKTDVNPAIGVINDNVFIKVKDYNSLDELLSLDKVADCREDEISTLVRSFNLFEKTLGKNLTYKMSLQYVNDFFTVSYSEAIEILDKCYYRKIDEKELAKLQRIIESHNRDWLG